MANRNGSRQRILDFLLANVGRIIEGEEIREASSSTCSNGWNANLRKLASLKKIEAVYHQC